LLPRIIIVLAPKYLDKKDRDRLVDPSSKNRQPSRQPNKKALADHRSLRAYLLI